MNERARYGRTPVGQRINLSFDSVTKTQLDAIARRYGQRRSGALIRIALRRLLTHPDPHQRLRAYERVEAERRALPWKAIRVRMSQSDLTAIDDLARQHNLGRNRIVRVALARFVASPGRAANIGQELLAEYRQDNEVLTSFRVNASHRTALNDITSKHGQLLDGAGLRIAIRRLVATPGDLVGDSAHIDATRDMRNGFYGTPFVAYFDPPLLASIDDLAHKLGQPRAVLARAAVSALIRAPGNIEAALDAEVYRGDTNRDKLIARHKRRRATPDNPR